MHQLDKVTNALRPFPLDPVFGPARQQARLVAGTPLEIVKLDPGGEHVVTYPGVVLPNPDQADWLITEARWVNRTIDLGGLTFHTGDRLIETFSTSQPYNCFAVHDPETNALRGWYANVTYPVRIESLGGRTRVIWHDLYLDVIGTPDGYLSLRDEDELAESGLATSDPALHQAIREAAHYVIERLVTGAFPFLADAS